MIVFRNKSRMPQDCLGSVVALGNFDGLHVGHREVIGKAQAIAKQLGKKSSVLTFEPHPRRIFNPDLPTMRIISFSEKARLLKEMNVDFMRVIRFTRDFSQTTAGNFIKDIMLGELQASHIVTGDDFVFGYNREGNVEYLRSMSAQEGFGYTVCSQVSIAGERCSSTRIRRLLARGKVEEIPVLLGRPYSITAIIRLGDKRGRELGFPTANLLPGRIFTPALGVYAVRAKMGDTLINGVANLGVRPTFGGGRLQLEVHLFDWNQDIYGEHLEVVFEKYIRSEKKFEGIEELKKQISDDCEQARNILT